MPRIVGLSASRVADGRIWGEQVGLYGFFPGRVCYGLVGEKWIG